MINIVSKGDELLETRLNEATNPLNHTLNVAATDAFCEQIINEPEGPQIAVRLLAHKVQSPQEKEALYSFAVIDECVKKCGPRFHQEIGKFRFLNELIKVISPKYLALHMSPAVKKRCIECLYSLYKGIPHEIKLAEAYSMLKKQRIITNDPTYMDDKIFKVSVLGMERPKSIFESSKDSERLSKLLKSRNPDDLREANRIIKNVVQADNNRIEQLSRRQTELEAMRNNIELLGEMLNHYIPGEGSPDDLFIMKELVENLEKSRSEMFKLSRETEEDEWLNEIIKVIDECNVIIRQYWDKIGTGNTDGVGCVSQKSEPGLLCQDLLGDSLECDLLSTDLHSMGIHDTDNYPTSSAAGLVNSAPLTKYDELMDIFSSQNSDSLIIPINGNINSSPSVTAHNHTPSNTNTTPNVSTSTVNTNPTKLVNSIPNRNAKVEYKGFEDLDVLSKEIFNLHKRKEEDSSMKFNHNLDVELLSSLEEKDVKKSSTVSNDLPLLTGDLGCPVPRMSASSVPGGDASVVSSSSSAAVPVMESKAMSPDPPAVDLTAFNVSLSAIKPHSLKVPLVIYNNKESKVKVMLHFANDRPHPNVPVMVAQISTENSSPVSDIVLKFAVSKPNKVRKLTGQTNMLPAHSPFTPSTPINEVVLLYTATPNVSITIKYQLSYELNGESFLESAVTAPIDF